jgi:hypothetical protein
MFYVQIDFMFWKLLFICFLIFLIYILHLRFFILTSNVIIKYIMLFYIFKTLIIFKISIYRLKGNPYWFNQQKINWWIQALWLKVIWSNLVNYIWDILGTNHRISYIITTVCMSVRPTMVPRLNGPAEPARTVGFRKWESARTVGFRKG